MILAPKTIIKLENNGYNCQGYLQDDGNPTNSVFIHSTHSSHPNYMFYKNKASNSWKIVTETNTTALNLTTMVKVKNDEGLSLSISSSYILHLLTTGTVLKDGYLQGSFMPVWDNETVLLVPEDKEYYKEAIKNQKILYGKKWITPSKLIEGNVYLFDGGDKKVYLGKHDYYSWDNIRSKTSTPQSFFVKVSEDMQKIDTSLTESYTVMPRMILADLGPLDIAVYGSAQLILNSCVHYAPTDETKTRYIQYSEDHIRSYLNKHIPNTGEASIEGILVHGRAGIDHLANVERIWGSRANDDNYTLISISAKKDTNNEYKIYLKLNGNFVPNIVMPLKEFMDTYKPCYLQEHNVKGFPTKTYHNRFTIK